MKKFLFALFSIAPLITTSIALAACGANDLKNADIILSETHYVYDGTAHYPDVTVKFGGKELDNTQISLSYSDNLNAGEATVTVTPTAGSKYSGSQSVHFTIEQAETVLDSEIYVTAEYNQTIGEVLGNRYNIVASEDGYTSDTRLTVIGENVYSLISLYTPSDINYKSVHQTVYITVKQATPEGVDLIKGMRLQAQVGDFFADLDGLPAGVRVSEPEQMFERTGTVAVDVVIEQIVDGKADDVHYEVVRGKQIPVEVHSAEVEIAGNSYLYDSVGFQNIGNGTYAVDGNVTLETLFESCGDWTVSIEFEGAISQFELYTVFDNVLSSAASDIKMNRFDFEAKNITSWLGTADTNWEGSSSDTVNFPSVDGWNGYKVTIVSTMYRSSITRRNYFIYFGDAASDELGTLVFSRHTPRKNAYRFRYVFTGADGVRITNIDFSESPYVHSKLLSEKFSHYVDSDGVTIKKEYTDGGILMVGDSLIDFWGMDFDTDRSTHAGADTSKAAFARNGFGGPVVNLGVGSASAEDWLNYVEADRAKELFAQLNPEVVFILIGCNQITREDEKNIAETVIAVIEKFANLYPNAQIVVNSMMPTTAKNSERWPLWYRLANANTRITEYIGSSQNDRLYFLDLQSLFTPNRSKKVSATNSPQESYHAKDGLHYRTVAYDLWTEEVFNFIKANGLLHITGVDVSVRDASGADLSDIAEVACNMYNGKFTMTLSLGDAHYLVGSVKLDSIDITAHYDRETGMLKYTLESYGERVSLVITLRYDENADDNVIGDDTFQ